MFDALTEIFREEEECGRRFEVVQQCLKRQRLAAGAVDQITSLGGKGDPNRPGVLQVLDRAVGDREDFYEGRVLAAFAQASDGNPDEAREHLDRACIGVEKFRLFGTAFAHDCCHADTLLGTPDLVDRYVTDLRKLDPVRQTSMRCWLVGWHAMLCCRDHEADTFLRKALAKAKVLAGGATPAGVAPLLGEAIVGPTTAALPSGAARLPRGRWRRPRAS